MFAVKYQDIDKDGNASPVTLYGEYSDQQTAIDIGKKIMQRGRWVRVYALISGHEASCVWQERY